MRGRLRFRRGRDWPPCQRQCCTRVFCEQPLLSKRAVRNALRRVAELALSASAAPVVATKENNASTGEHVGHHPNGGIIPCERSCCVRTIRRLGHRKMNQETCCSDIFVYGAIRSRSLAERPPGIRTIVPTVTNLFSTSLAAEIFCCPYDSPARCHTTWHGRNWKERLALFIGPKPSDGAITSSPTCQNSLMP